MVLPSHRDSLGNTNLARGEPEQVLPRRKAQHPEEILACGANYNNTLTLLRGPTVQGLVEAEEDITAQMCFGVDLWSECGKAKCSCPPDT